MKDIENKLIKAIGYAFIKEDYDLLKRRYQTYRKYLIRSRQRGIPINKEALDNINQRYVDFLFKHYKKKNLKGGGE